MLRGIKYTRKDGPEEAEEEHQTHTHTQIEQLRRRTRNICSAATEMITITSSSAPKMSSQREATSQDKAEAATREQGAWKGWRKNATERRTEEERES